MLLAIDVGNTHIKLGVYDAERLVAHWRLTTARAQTADEYGAQVRQLFALASVDFKAIKAVVISSSVPPLNYTLMRMSQIYFEHTPLIVDHSTDTGMHVLYNPPSDVGADRIVDAVAAREKYGAPSIVVDFGTATTFNVIDRDGRYLGGVITPGILISTNALFERAARLPRVEIRKPQAVIGNSTVGAIQAGLYYGYVGLVDGILRRMLEELGQPARVVATGGLATLIATGSEFIETVDDTLTLEGLRIIYGRSQKQTSS